MDNTMAATKELKNRLKLMRTIATDPKIKPIGKPLKPAEYIRQLNELNGYDVVAYLRAHGL